MARPDPAALPIEHAVVIGASLAGLLAAQALGSAGVEVTIIERDRVPDGPEPRAGVPQSRHTHVLWSAGRQAIERLLPGIEHDLLAAGGHNVGMPEEMRELTPAGHWVAPFRATQQMLSVSRARLEYEVRRRVLASDRVNLVEEQDVQGLRTNPDGDIRGVTIRPRAGGATVQLVADLVVDASGRGSHLPDWLEAVGRTRPRQTVVDSFLGYATQLYAVPEDWAADWRVVFMPAAPPARVRAGLITPIEGGQWSVTLIGGARDYPPTDHEGFVAFARSLPSPVIADAISAARPVGPVRGYRRTSNQRRHYERLRDLPDGLLVLGDSLCTFNPVYGQGITVAALQAEVLRRELGRSADAAGRPSLRQVQRALAGRADHAWLMATGEDLRYPTTVGARATLATRISHRYMDRVLATVHADPVVNAAFQRVLHMVEPPTAMFRPAVLMRVLGRRRAPGLAATAAKPETTAAAATLEPVG